LRHVHDHPGHGARLHGATDRRGVRQARAQATRSEAMSLWVPWSEMPASGRWSAAADLLCVAGFAASIAAAFVHGRAARRDAPVSGAGVSVVRAPFVCLVATLVAMLVS